jgi:hypothetical protein
MARKIIHGSKKSASGAQNSVPVNGDQSWRSAVERL